jgi:isopenicillin-N epimerase
VFEAYQAIQLELEREPVDFLARQLPDRLLAARQALATYLGARTPDLAFVANATTGVNIVANSLRLSTGDVILATDHEYGACDRTMRFVCAKTGASLQHVAIETPLVDGLDIVDTIAEALDTEPRPKLLLVSHITSPTALVFPVQAICAVARELGVLTLVDGAHAPGQIELDITAVGADFYTGNCHKWMCAPKGAGFLHAAPAAQEILGPLIVSWGWQADVPSMSRLWDEQEWAGTRDPAAWLAVPAAIEYQAARNWPSVRAECHELLRYARDGLLAIGGVEPLHPDDPALYAQMEAVELPPCDPLAVSTWLWDNARVEIPGVAWNGKALLRASVQSYNSVADVDRLLTALPRCLDALGVAHS